MLEPTATPMFILAGDVNTSFPPRCSDHSGRSQRSSTLRGWICVSLDGQKANGLTT